MLRIVRRSLAGHSKWANIRHKKGGKDAAKADQFQKLAKVIETSSRLAGGDRSHPALASALSRAKDARMPKRTVDAAVTRGGADKTAGAGLEELVYEAVWKSKFYRAFVLNRRVDLHAIDATPARWRGDAGSSPLNGASTAASAPINDFAKNCTRRTG